MRTRLLSLGIAAVTLAALAVPLPALAASPATLAGTVTGPGGPLAVSVQWYEASSGEHGGTTSSASDGSYSLTVPAAAHDYYIVANLDLDGDSDGDGGYRRVNDTVVSEFYGEGGAHDELLDTLAPYSGPTGGSLDIALGATGGIAGSSAALAHRTVSLVAAGDTATLTPVATTTADSHGAFRFEHLVPGHFRVTGGGDYYTDPLQTPLASSSAVMPFMSPVITVTAGAVTEFAATVRVGATVTGTLTAHGKPVRYAAVSVSQHGASVGETLTDAKGRFTLDGLASGGALVTLDQGDYSSYLGMQSGTGVIAATPVHVTLREGATTRVALHAAPGGRINGTVDTKRGLGVTGKVQVEVRAADGRAYPFYGDFFGTKSGADEYTVSSLPSGRYTVFAVDAAHGRWGSARVVVHAGHVTRAPVLRLTRRTVTLSGHVKGATSGGVIVSASSVLRGGTSIYATGRVTASGSYLVHGVIPGTVQALFVDQEHALGTPTVIHARRSVRHDLSAGTALGRVAARVLLGGRPLDGIGFEFVPSSAAAPTQVDLVSLSISQLLQNYGGVVMGGRVAAALPAGTYTLHATGRDLESTVAQQPGAPFTIALSRAHVVVHPGVVTDLGTLTASVLR